MLVHIRNKKRKKFLRGVCPNQTYHIPKNPYELEYRIENSKNSVWCKYELNYFLQLNRPMFVIDKRCIENGEFIVEPLKTDWFVDSNYRNFSYKCLSL